MPINLPASKTKTKQSNDPSKQPLTIEDIEQEPTPTNSLTPSELLLLEESGDQVVGREPSSSQADRNLAQRIGGQLAGWMEGTGQDVKSMGQKPLSELMRMAVEEDRMDALIMKTMRDDMGMSPDDIFGQFLQRGRSDYKKLSPMIKGAEWKKLLRIKENIDDPERNTRPPAEMRANQLSAFGKV